MAKKTQEGLVPSKEEKQEMGVTIVMPVLKDTREENMKDIGSDLAFSSGVTTMTYWRLGFRFDGMEKNISKYGSGLAEEIAERFGLSTKIVQEAHRHYMLNPDINQMSLLTEKNPHVLWTHHRILNRIGDEKARTSWLRKAEKDQLPSRTLDKQVKDYLKGQIGQAKDNDKSKKKKVDPKSWLKTQKALISRIKLDTMAPLISKIQENIGMIEGMRARLNDNNLTEQKYFDDAVELLEVNDALFTKALEQLDQDYAATRASLVALQQPLTEVKDFWVNGA